MTVGEKTENWMGISEMIVGSAVCGVIFALFSGQPLVIIGVTGPILVFEENLYSVSIIRLRYFGHIQRIPATPTTTAGPTLPKSMQVRAKCIPPTYGLSRPTESQHNLPTQCCPSY